MPGTEIIVALIAGACGLAGGFLGHSYVAKKMYAQEILRMSAEMAKIDFETHKGDENDRLPLSSIVAFYQVYFTAVDKESTPSDAVALGLVEMENSIKEGLQSNFNYYEKFNTLFKK